MSRLLTTTEPQHQSAASSAELSAIFDLSTLLDRCMGDAGLAARLLERFGARLPKAVAEIECSLATQDRSELVKQSHTLKGEAGSLAAVRLQQAAAELETCLRNEPNLPEAEIVRLAAAIATEAEQCRQRLPETLDALSTAANPA